MTLATADPMTCARALTALARMPTTTRAGLPPCVRTQAVFGRAPTGIALPLNRKTTQQAIITIPLDGLEPRQEFMPTQGLESYIVRPRRDPPDVARVQMRDGRERLLVQEGHTRLGAAVLRGDASLPIRVWEFIQTDTGGFEPIIRGRHRIGIRHRDRLKQLAAAFDLVGNERSGNWGHAGRKGEVGGSGPGTGPTPGKIDRAEVARLRDEREALTDKHGVKTLGDLDKLLKSNPKVREEYNRIKGQVEIEEWGVPKTEGGKNLYKATMLVSGPGESRAADDWVENPRVDKLRAKYGPTKTEAARTGTAKEESADYARGVAMDKLIGKYGADWMGMLKKIETAKLGPALVRGELDHILDLKPTPKGKKKIETDWGVELSEVINLPNISDVNFPTIIGAIPSTPPRKKRRPVHYKGVKLSRAPMEFEVKVLSLSEIPPRLDLAVTALKDLQTPLDVTVREVAQFGMEQALMELVRQGAPDRILATPPSCADAVEQLAATVGAERTQDLDRAQHEATIKLSHRRIPIRRREILARELFDRQAPWIITRHAKRAVNMAFALGRATVIEHYRRPHEPVHLAYHDDEGKFTSKYGALVTGAVWVDKVIQTAVMDTNTCEDCEEVDGEVMELGDDRQQELHPPYVKCAGGDRCRCVQIALLSDGSEIEVDEVPDEAYDED